MQMVRHRWGWGVSALLALLLLVGGAAQTAQAQLNYCAAEQSPTFVLGFAQLKAQLGAAMGEPLECEHYDTAGNAMQMTTTGQAMYNKSTGMLMFTNEQQQWMLTANGLVTTASDGQAPSARVLPPAQPNAPMQAVLTELGNFNAPAIADVPPRIAREQPTAADAVVAVLAKQGTGYIPEAVADVAHIVIPGPPGGILARVYTPAGNGPFPVIVYFHGGGFVIANINVYDSSARALTNAAQAVVVSVAYRQAPETKFPGPVEDAYTATQWVMQNAATLNGDPNRVAVAGESAGGNAATVVSMMARDRGGMMPVHQLLVYPLVQWNDLNTPSYETYANAVPLNRAGAQWFADNYLPSAASATNAYASPLRATNLSGLPPATIIAAEIDPLLSEGQQYAERLRGAGVPVTYRLFNNVTHEFFGMGAVLDEAKQAVALAGEQLKIAFDNQQAAVVQ